VLTAIVSDLEQTAERQGARLAVLETAHGR
jgi:hypothetical protein